MRPLCNSLCVAILLLISARFITADDAQKQRQLEGFLVTAQAADLRATNSAPFHLVLKLHVQQITAKPLEGSYDEVWNGPDQWHREINFPQFRQVEIGDKEGRWLDRNLDFRPQPAYLVAELLGALMSPMHSQNAKVSKIKTVKKDGVELHCVTLEESQVDYSLCFDEQGRLAASGFRNLYFEFSQYEKFGEKVFPREMVVQLDHKQVLEARVESLAPPVAAAVPPHSPSAIRLSRCERWEPGIPVKKVPPRYPDSARFAHQEGTVVLYALLLPDGSVKHLKLLQSAGSALDQSAVEAVQQWVYAPSDCTDSPFPTEIQISVNYRLQ